MGTLPEDQVINPEIQDVDQNYRDLVSNVTNSVAEATGEAYQVEPTTAFTDLYNHPGNVSSKNFLTKLKEHVASKNPGAVVREK